MGIGKGAKGLSKGENLSRPEVSIVPGFEARKCDKKVYYMAIEVCSPDGPRAAHCEASGKGFFPVSIDRIVKGFEALNLNDKQTYCPKVE